MSRLPSLLSLAVLLMPAVALATTLRVPGEYATIQAGIDAASDGDTVLVAPGTYKGSGNRNLDFGRTNLVLLSEDGPEATVIDVEWSGRGFHFHGGETRDAEVRGFTIKNGFGDVPYVNGAGILCESSSPTIADCIITDNYISESSAGAGICSDNDSSPRITGCVISRNHTGHGSNSGAGIRCGGETTVSECIISNNGGGDLSGAGIYCRGSATITDCVIMDNHIGVSGGRGAGISCSDSATVSGCVITGNDVEGGEFASGGGISCGGSSRIVDCIVTGNSVVGLGGNGRGGGISASSSVSIVRCTISGNSVRGPDSVGGGVSVWANGFLSLEQTILWGNCADLDGDEAYTLDSSSVVVFTCSAVDSAGIGGVGQVMYDGDQVFTDPLLCDPELCESAPTGGGDYGLGSRSPCLPENSPCGELIGALPMGCDVSSVSVAPTSGLRLRLASIAPNPTHGAIRYVVESAGVTEARVRIVDVSGRLVRELFRGELPRGASTRTATLRDANGRPLPSGVYYLDATSSLGRAVKSFVVTR